SGLEICGICWGQMGLHSISRPIGMHPSHSNLLSFLLYTLALDPSGLPHEVERLAPWIRGLTFALVLVTWAMPAAVVASHPVLATLLALCSAVGGLKYTVFKTAIDRGSFPKLQ